MTDQPVLVETADGVRTIRLNRPEAMNSLDIATKVALRDALADAASDDTVRCVVLTGSGRAFCVGQDLKEHVRLLADEAGSEQLFTTVEEHYNPIVQTVLTMPKPVIAAINGVAAGAGASLAFAADLRIVADSAGFNLAFAGIALSCDTGASWTLPRLVGQAKALELLLMPRTVPAAEALELGLATQVVAPEKLESTVGELAARFAAGPTVAYGAIRRAVRESAALDIPQALAREAELMNLTGATRDHQHAVEAFVAKQAPVFEGR